MKSFYFLCALALAACSSSHSSSQVIAQCEQQEYGQIGVQADENSTLEYALKKRELVRVCALSAGLTFRSEKWGSYSWMISERVYRQYGIWSELPSSEKYKRYIGPAMDEIDRQKSIEIISPVFWE